MRFCNLSSVVNGLQRCEELRLEAQKLIAEYYHQMVARSAFMFSPVELLFALFDCTKLKLPSETLTLTRRGVK